MLKQRDKVMLSLLVALFAALALGERLPAPVLNWWCVAFPDQSPLQAAAGEDVIYSFKLLELLRGLF